MNEEQAAPLNQYLEPLLNHRRLLFGVWALVIALGVAAGVAAPVSYSSTAAILVYPSSSDPAKALESDDAKIDMPTELRIATSQAVINLVMERFAEQGISASTRSVSDNITASTTKESTILDLTFVAATPQLAAAGANAFAKSYLDFRAELATSNKLAAESAINARITLLQERLGAVEAQLSRPGISDRIILESDKNTVEADLEAQQVALGALSTPTIDATVIIDEAATPLYPEGLGLIQIIVGAVAGGLVMGVSAAFVAAAYVAGKRVPVPTPEPESGTTKLEPAELEVKADAKRETKSQESDKAASTETVDPVVQVVETAPLVRRPTVRPEPLQDRRTSADEDEVETDTPSPVQPGEQEVDKAKRAIVASGDMEPVIKYLQSIGARGPVTSLSVGERGADAATTVTLDLADALQTLGARVLVIDAALATPTLGAKVGVSRGPGLVDVLSGVKTLSQAAKKTATLGGVDVLTVGNVTRQSATLIRVANMERLLAEARMHYHSILLIGGQLDEGVIIRTIASLTDGVIVGTDRAPGALADAGLKDRLAALPAPTLELLSARDSHEMPSTGAASEGAITARIV